MTVDELSELFRALRTTEDAEKVLQIGIPQLRSVSERADALKLVSDLAASPEDAPHRFILVEALHVAGRLMEADEVMRATRANSDLRQGFDELCRGYRPRAQERMRFYRCHSEFDLTGKDVLEVGGRLPSYFVSAAMPKSWTSLDLLVEEEVETARYRLRQGDTASMPLDDESIDLVFSSSAFEHIADLRTSLAEMARVLRPGGIVYSDFGPIWSSAEGHHLRSRARDALIEAGLWPLPPWAHLTMSRREMRQHLASELDAEQQRVVERWLYRRPTINRLFYEDYVHLFHASPLSVRRLDLKIGDEPIPEALKRLQRRHPGRTNFHVTGFRAILKKP